MPAARPRGRPKGTPKTGGRQPGSHNKVTAEVKELAAPYGPEAVEKLVHLMRHGETEQTQRAAAEALIDRGYGRPTMQVHADIQVATRAVYHDPTAHLEPVASQVIEGIVTEVGDDEADLPSDV